MISISDVTKKFGENYLFEKVTLFLEGGVYLLSGNNGSGKSTLLRMIHQLDKNYEGKIRTSGNKTLFLTTEPVGLFPFTLKENYELLWKAFGLEKRDKEIIIEDFFDYKQNIPYLSASTGLKAKVGLSLVFMDSWDQIFIDESLATIDRRSQKIFLDEIFKNQKQAVTIIVSHTNLLKDFGQKYSELIIEDRGIIIEKDN